MEAAGNQNAETEQIATAADAQSVTETIADTAMESTEATASVVADTAALQEQSAPDTQKSSAKPFSLARVERCIMELWHAVNRGEHEIVAEIEKILGIGED